MQVYKFRAECAHDSFEIFKCFLTNKVVKINDYKLTVDGVEFKSEKSLLEIREVLKGSSLIDIHVAKETLQKKENYTGMRTYCS